MIRTFAEKCKFQGTLTHEFGTAYQGLDQCDVRLGPWRAIILEGLYAGNSVDSAAWQLGLCSTAPA